MDHSKEIITSLAQLIEISHLNKGFSFSFRLSKDISKDLLTLKSTNLKDMIIETIPLSWQSLFNELYQDFLKINQILEGKYQDHIIIFPEIHNILNIFYDLQPKNIKVLILGQDPYYTLDHQGYPYAHGYAFSTLSSEIPSSLQNIMIEIKHEYPDLQLSGKGNLLPWVKQGVFLLNSALTVEMDQPGSHIDIWQPIINRIINYISIVNPKCVFLLLGSHARNKKNYINKNCLIITAPHPSMRSVNKGFLGCNCFIKINDILKKRKDTEINWFF